ncbi:MAG: T9SS type A sorting domain-containing protein [Bacteroidetes bacterium]|nr:T9SS type A sorting domain-containing protein [Bacteroidota bacterium]
MKKLALLFLFSINLSFSQVSYVWNGSTSTNWTTPSNWTPSGVPGVSDNVTIVTGGNNCLLAGNTTVSGLTITTGVLNLNTFSLTTNSVVACNGGNCNNGSFVSNAISLTFAGTTFGANVFANVTDVYFNGSTFNGSLTVTRNNSSSIQSTGNNTFNGATSITNAGTGYLLMTNSSARTDVFNSTSTFATTNTGGLYIGYSGASSFNGNVLFNNPTGSGNIQIGRSGGPTSTLNTGLSITCGTFFGGAVNLFNLNQLGSAPLNISPGNSGGVNIYSSTINGSLTVSAGVVSAQTSTFANTVTYNLGGTILNNWSNGGNVYNGTLTINNASNGFIGFASSAGDTYNADVYCNNTSTTGGRIIFGNNSTSQFNGNVYVNQNGTTSASGISIGWSGTFPLINFAAGKSVLVNGSVTSGYIQLLKVQTAASTTINLTTTGTSAIILNNNTFNGPVSASAPDLYPQGGTYNAPTVFVKTGGGTGNHNSGNLNTFNSTLELDNLGGGGYLLLSYNSNDQFNGNITVNTNGSTAGTGISLGWPGSGGVPVLAAGKTISVGVIGFSTGYLQLCGLNQLGSTAITLTLTGNASFTAGKSTPPCNFGGAVNVTSPDIYIQGSVFNGRAIFTKTGGSSNHNSGNLNTFNASTTVNQQSSTGYFMLGYNSADMFNDSIIVSSTGTGGIFFGWPSSSGTPSLAAGKSIFVGSGGFSAGSLQFNRFTQLGSAPVNLTFTGTNAAYVAANSSIFGGDLNLVAPDIYFNGATYQGKVSAKKTGAGSDASIGGNTFNGLSFFENAGSGYMMFGNGSPDVWNSDVNFNVTGSERILPAYNSAGNLFNGNVFLNSSGSALGINFCAGTPASNATIAATKALLTGSLGLNAGYVIAQRITQLGTASNSIVMGAGTNYSQFGPGINLGGGLVNVSQGMFFNGGVFNGTISAIQQGAVSAACVGSNTFNAVSSFTNSGSGYFLLGNTSPDVFNADVYFINNGSERILPAWNSAGNLFNGNIYLSNTGSASGINFCGGGSGSPTATMSAGHTVSITAAGFNTGYLILPYFTQLGNVPINLFLTGSLTYLQTYGNSYFGGNFTAVSPRILLANTTFSGTNYFCKTGATGEWSNGGNLFGGVTTMSSTASGYFGFANSQPDTYNSDLIVSNNGSDRIIFANTSIGNTYNGNIIVNQMGSSIGTVFGYSPAGTSTLVAGKTFSVGGGGFNVGYLQIQKITQLGSVPINLPINGSALYYGPNAILGGNVTSTSSSLYFNGCIFNGTTNCLKTGGTNDISMGNNTFNGNSLITDNGAGYLLLANGNPDIFNANANFVNTGSANFYVAYNSVGNVFNAVTTFSNSPSSLGAWMYAAPYALNNATFNGNIIVSNNNGGGVFFGNNTGTSTLSAGNTISVGSGGFNSGYLVLRNFTQLGSTPQSITTTGTSILQYGPSSAFGGNVVSISPGLLFNGCNFSGTTNCLKNGATNDQSIGNNIFNGNALMTNTGSGYLMFGNGNSDVFNANANFVNVGSNSIYVAYNSIGNTFNGTTTFSNSPTSTAGWIYSSAYSANNTTFNGNIVISNNNGGGINFCASSGQATLTAGNAISVGSGGFANGVLSVNNFTQSGTTAQNVLATGTSIFNFYNSQFNGPLTTTSGGITYKTSVFNSSVTATKLPTGTTNDVSYGANTFNSTFSVTSNCSAGYILFANNMSDSYFGDVIFNQNGTSRVYPNYNTNCVYAGNVTVGSTNSSTITFGANVPNGVATFTNSNPQNISKTGSAGNPVFTYLSVNKSADSIYLQTMVNIAKSLTLTQGVINTTSVNILNLNNNALTNIGNASSFVNGPLNYDMLFTGTRTLNMPLGKSPDWRPAVLTVNHSNSSPFTYNSEVFNANAQALGWALPVTVWNVSKVHWWDIKRYTTGTTSSQPTSGLSSTQTITLYYDANDGVSNSTNLTICKNTYTALTSWIDIGGTGASNITGSVQSTSAPSLFNSFSRFTLGNKVDGTNPLPITLLSFSASPLNSQVNVTWQTATERNNAYFAVERSTDAVNFTQVATVNAYGNGNAQYEQSYSTIDVQPLKGISYYRLKQFDKTGNFTYSNIQAVNFSSDLKISLYPNPSTGILNIQANEMYNNAIVRVFSSNGSEVLPATKLSSFNGKLDLSNFEPGIFQVIVENNGKTSVFKITLMK